MPCFGIRSTISDETRCPFEFEKTNFIIYELLPILHLLSGWPNCMPFPSRISVPSSLQFCFQDWIRKSGQT